MPGSAHSPRPSDSTSAKRAQKRARKQVRGTRVTAAVLLLVLATLLLAASLALREPVLIGAAGVVALVTGWVGLRLAWNELVLARYEHAVDRTDLARAYRELFDTGAADHGAFAGAMETRASERERRIAELRQVLSRVETRAVEQASAAREVQARLDRAEAQIEKEAEDRVARALQAQEASGSPSGPPARGSVPTPEWAFLEPDQLSSLLAWEEHARRVTQGIAQGVAGPADRVQGRRAG